MEMFGAAVPVFSAMLVRERLVECFLSQAPPLTVVCASAGYGKTTLASQFAERGRFDAVAWVQLPDSDVSGELLLRQVADVLDSRTSHPEDLISEGLRPLESVALDDSARIRERLDRLRGHRVLLVIDGANGLSGDQELMNLASELTRSTSPESRVVVTCRRFDADPSVNPSAVWFVEEQDLAFTLPEILELLPESRESDRDAEAGRVYDYCLGHPAITRILMRHGGSYDDVRPRDLIWQTERIISKLDEDAVASLYIASILGRGAVDSLSRCALACDLRADWSALSRAVPLFHVFRLPNGARSFRAHAVLCDVLERLVSRRMCEDDRAFVRSVALEQLSRDCDYIRLAAALEVHGTQDEIAAWCECDGASMLRHVGHPSVARLMAKLPSISIASSSRLLLLRSHVQRAWGSTAAALESAIMARRIAEVDEDVSGLVTATLLIARLNLDRGMIGESRKVLEEIESQSNSHPGIGVHCVTQAYLALADGQAGRLSDAMRRVELLSATSLRMDQGSDEAVFVANSMGAVACHCTGDWRAAAAALDTVVRRTDIAPLQQVHVSSNYAAALYELGDVEQASTQARGALADCATLGLTSLYPSVAATLSDVSYAVGDHEQGRELARRALAALDCTEDILDRAILGINASRALRALGEYDESLSVAMTAQSQLQAQGASVRMMHLLATIEVAASHLALGDVALARVNLERVKADPSVYEALGHSLRCELLCAEIDRLEGEYRAAAERLVRHSEYVATGSGNMTLTCYIRAFPSLLGILGQSFGADALPIRVIRLLGADTLEKGLAAANEMFGSELGIQLRDRFVSSHCLAASGEDPKPCTPERHAVLRVCAFGKFEVESHYGRVEHKHWRKRKARSLFLMLLCAPSHELPREVILERLWPEMEYDTARRNFYVTWSHMRKALVCLDAGADLGVFADANSSACWLTDALESDLDMFAAELSTLRAARVVGDKPAVVASAVRLSGLYRGELLPVDLYEEWFEQDRIRTRRDFCDAMVTGAQCAVEVGQHDTAVSFLRRASEIDMWREDVYQLTMMCQMAAGQRSGAIETYNQCRERLVEDLGIDPCAETVRIFQTILAMEDGDCTEPAFLS